MEEGGRGMMTDILLGCIVGSLVAIGQNLRRIASALEDINKRDKK